MGEMEKEGRGWEEAQEKQGRQDAPSAGVGRQGWNSPVRSRLR